MTWFGNILENRDGVFPVKSANLLKFSTQFEGVMAEEQARFSLWGKVWGLGLPP